jgi:hypothetical protein
VADHDITLGEVHRNQAALERRLDNAIANAVGVREYLADQKGTHDRLEHLGSAISGVRADFASLDTKHDADIQAVRTEHAIDVKEMRAEAKDIAGKQDAYEEAQRSSRSKWILTWVGLIAGPILVAVVGILFRGVSAP